MKDIIKPNPLIDSCDKGCNVGSVAECCPGSGSVDISDRN